MALPIGQTAGFNIDALINAKISSAKQSIDSKINSKLSQIQEKTGVSFSQMLNSFDSTEAGVEAVSKSDSNTIYKTLDLSSLFGIQASYNQSALKSNSQSFPDKYDHIIESVAQKYNLSEDLIKAVIKQESGFNPNATSHAGAQGLMQLMPATAAGLGVTNSYDPVQNIDGGAKYLRGQLDRFGGNVMLALAAYNAGPGRVSSSGVTDLNKPEQMAKLPKETQNYVRNIMSAFAV